jgi:DNA-binding MarR family transcriptional regulator/GNAT superfamily N-acetyltransferase
MATDISDTARTADTADDGVDAPTRDVSTESGTGAHAVIEADAAGMDATIDAVRAFNRFHTSWIGALDYAGRLGTPYSLTEARVLYELSRADVLAVTRLREDLRAERAHLSRVLSRLEENGLLVREDHPDDRRAHLVRLSRAGREAAAMLDVRSQKATGDMVQPLTAGRRRKLTHALRTAQEVLSAPEPAAVTLRDPEPGDLGWVIERNAVIYAREYGWNSEYEALVARIVADFAAGHDPRREALWIAEYDGERAGCVFCVRDERPETARLRLLLVEPEARGHRIGQALVERCVGFARDAGYRNLVLWTNDVLTAARKIYQRAGFELVSQSPHHSFGKDLVGQDWRLEL